MRVRQRGDLQLENSKFALWGGRIVAFCRNGTPMQAEVKAENQTRWLAPATSAAGLDNSTSLVRRTCTGARQLSVPPWPSLPNSPSPQVNSRPSTVTAAVWNAPQDTCTRRNALRESVKD